MSTTLKISLSILGTIALAAGLFLWRSYSLHGSKETILNEKAPYNEIVGKSFVLQENVVVAKIYDTQQKEALYVMAKDMSGTGGSEGPAYQLLAGTKISLENAKMYDAPINVKGIPYVLGKVFIEELGREVEFEYQWGEKAFHNSTDEQGSYRFSRAPWQEKALEDTFRLD